MAFGRMGIASANFGRLGALGGAGIPSWVNAGAAFDLDFANTRYYGGSLAALLSITRASSKTNLLPSSASGFAYATFLSNVLAITSLGLSIEFARTNLFLNSSAPATQTITLPATGAYALWVNGAGSAAIAAGTATITGAGTATNSAPVIINCSVAGTVIITISGALNACQLEAGPDGTSYIATTGAPVTRAGDNIQAIGTLAAALTASAASIVSVVGEVTNIGASARIVGGPATGKTAQFVASNTTVGIYDGATVLNATLGAGTFTANTVKIGSSYDGTGRSLVANNGTVASDTAASQAPSSCSLGSNGGTSNFLDGNVRRLTVYTSRLAGVALKALTV